MALKCPKTPKNNPKYPFSCHVKRLWITIICHVKHRILRLAKIETVSHETTHHGNVVVDNAKTVENGDFNKW